MERSARHGDQGADENPTINRVPPAKSASLPDPEAFFRRESRDEARASFAQTRAQQVAPPMWWTTAARAVHLQTAAWPLVTIAVAVLYLWAQNLRPAWGRPQLVAGLEVLALGALTCFGVALLRRGTRQWENDRQAQLGAALLLVAAIIGVLVGHGQPTAVTVLGVIGWLLAIGYVVVMRTGKTFPGMELLPAIALGPLLFFFTLLVFEGKRLSVTNGTWLLAGMLGAAQPATLESAIGNQYSRLLDLVLLVGAYGLVILAATGRHTSHGALAVLLSLPAAMLPLSGVAYARARAALRVVAAQTQRTLVLFGVWLAIGFVLGGAYLRLLAYVPHVLLPGTK